MKKQLIFGCVFCLLLAAAVVAKVQVVKLKSGAELKGEVTRNKDGSYEIRTDKGIVVVPADKVVSVEDVVTPRDEYEQRLAKLDLKDAKAHYELARWAFNAGLYVEARDLLTAALKLREEYPEARLLLRRVEGAIREQGAKPPVKPPVKPPIKDPLRLAGMKPEWFLTQQDIYRVRLEELRPKDVVPIRFKKKVLERFIGSMEGRWPEEMGREPDRRFRGWTPVRKVNFILDNIDEDNVSIRDYIEIRRDPKFMVEFRRRVWPLVRQNCASVQCHGGKKIHGGLKLFNVKGKNDRVDYTNFVILSTYEKKGRRLIERDHAEDSLLLQFGLPQALAESRHPKVPGRTRSAFSSRKVVNYRRMLKWISDLKGPLPRNYHLKWKPPFKMSLNLTGKPSLPKPPPETQPTTREKDEEKDEDK